MGTEDQSISLKRRVSLWAVVKWTICLLVIVAVGFKAYSLLQRDELQDIQPRPTFLVGSAVVYLLGWLPSVWFWRHIMQSLGESVSWTDSLRAYYCGHLGKYIPGKATVLLIRAGMLKVRGHSAKIAAVTATYETLSMMGVGLALGLVCLPFALEAAQLSEWPGWIQRASHSPGLFAGIIAVLVVCALPILARVLTVLAIKLTPNTANEDMRIGTASLAVGYLAFCAGWVTHGLSLGLVLSGVSTVPFDLSQWWIWMGAVALATSLGFVAVFAPGGIGVREGLLMAFLSAASYPSAVVVCGAITLRLVWLISEVLISGALILTRPKTVDIGQ